MGKGNTRRGRGRGRIDSCGIKVPHGIFSNYVLSSNDSSRTTSSYSQIRCVYRSPSSSSCTLRTYLRSVVINLRDHMTIKRHWPYSAGKPTCRPMCIYLSILRHSVSLSGASQCRLPIGRNSSLRESRFGVSGVCRQMIDRRTYSTVRMYPVQYGESIPCFFHVSILINIPN